MKAKSGKFAARLTVTLVGAAYLASALAGPALAAGPSSKIGLLVDNYWGQPATLNIEDTLYTVPADGQLFIPLQPGVYDLSANVNDDDAAARTAEIEIPAGQDLQMSYAASGMFFQPVAATQPDAAPAANATPSQPAAAQPATMPVVVLNSDITTAAAPDNQPHTIGPNQSLWYRLDLYASSQQAAVVSLLNGANSGLKLNLYSSSQFDEWFECTPEGIGGPDDSNNLTWATNVDTDKTWYARVINTTAQSITFRFNLSGPILAH